MHEAIHSQAIRFFFIVLAAMTLVPGAIAAICEAIVMNVPAEAALEPLGPTNVANGTAEFKIPLIICRMEVSSPPGVSMRITINSSPA